MVHAGPAGLPDNLFLLRHGESRCNTIHRIAGIEDVPLNNLGCAQAIEAGEEWRGGPFDIVFVSTMKRARQTADLVLTGMEPAPALIVDPRLAERDFGDYTLHNKAVLQRRHGVAEYERAMNADSPTMRDSEPIERFRQRIVAFYEETLLPAVASGKRVLVVSHKYVVEFLGRLILGLPLEGAYDLRLPNAQILCAADLPRTIGHESKWRNQLYDTITVNYYVVLAVAALAGLGLDLIGVRFQAPAEIQIAILGLATAIGLTTVEIEEAPRYASRRDIIWPAIWRFGLMPIALVAGTVVFGFEDVPQVLGGLALLAAPAGVIAVTASRCAGGLILPALAIVMVSSAVSLVPLALVLGAATINAVPWFLLISLALIAVTVFLPFAIVLGLRRRWPIRTAKFGVRNGHLAVLLLALFILLAMPGIDVGADVPAGLAAIGIAVLVKLVTALAFNRARLFAIDYFCAMTYPNAFILVVIGHLSDQATITHMAAWFLLAASVLAALDGVFAKSAAERGDPDDIRRLVGVGD
ncbi:MAG: histidine phosphatase family protein [Pseudomonadota bacterium]